MKAPTLLLAVSAWVAAPAIAQSIPELAGTYAATVQGLALRLSFVPLDSGKLVGLVDVPQQGAIGIPCPSVTPNGNSLAIACPLIRAEWKGEIAASGQTLNGFWSQGTRLPVDWKKTSAQMQTTGEMNAQWQAMLGTPERPLRVRLTTSKAGQSCKFSSVDEGKFDRACEVTAQGDALSTYVFSVPEIRGSWEGRMSKDGNFLLGQWSQQGAPGSVPLFFVRMH